MTCTKICMDAPFNALSPWTTRRAENLKVVQINTCNALHCECVWASVWPCVVFCNLKRRTMSPSQCQFDVQFDDHITVRPPVRRPKADEQVSVATQLPKRRNRKPVRFCMRPAEHGMASRGGGAFFGYEYQAPKGYGVAFGDPGAPSAQAGEMRAGFKLLDWVVFCRLNTAFHQNLYK